VLANRSAEPKTAWRVFREGIAPQLSTRCLLTLHDALSFDDPTLIQGATTYLPPLQRTHDWPVQPACPVAYVGLQGETLGTVREVEEFFSHVCWTVDKALGERAAIRHFLTGLMKPSGQRCGACSWPKSSSFCSSASDKYALYESPGISET